ncbi:HAD-IA family hydrolase [Parvibaculaceae bacterium PLY_AMNH_Bact1]|nr:HAD-IA family hydrolase [Parvibaculaceae bacterium PLY_AMNH_Bact1]
MTDIRALIFDVDGVLVTGHKEKGGWWHADMEKDLGLDPELFQRAFFTSQWADIVCGRQGIEEPLTKTLGEIAPHLSVQSLLDYWFRQDSRLEHKLLAELETLRSRSNIGLSLATNQEHRRANHLWKEIGLEHHFDAIHYSADIGHAKPNKEFFATVEDRTGFDGPHLLFFDDQERNVVAAREQGWQAHVWTGMDTFEKALLTHGL